MAVFFHGRGGRVVLESVRTYNRCSVSQAAAALAYFLLLTIFPLLLCMNYLIGLLHLNPGQLLGPVEQVLPEQVGDLVEAYLEDVSQNLSPTVFLAGLGSILFSASAGVRGVLHTLDRLYGRRPGRGLGRVAVSVALSGLSLLAVYVSAAVILAGGWFFRLLERLLPEGLVGIIPLPVLSGVWMGVRYVLLLSVMLLLVVAVYWAGSPPQIRDWGLIANAMASAVAIAACSAAFSWFVGVSVRYSVVYGSLASIIVLLVWLYLCGNILLTGAVLGWVLRGN